MGHWWANLTLFSGDVRGYARVCATLRDRFSDSSNMLQVVHLSWALIQGPDAIPDMEALITLAAKTVNPERDDPVCLTALAGAYLRNGQYEPALKCLDKSDRFGRDWVARPLNDLLRVIALLRSKRTSEARVVLEKARQFSDDHLKASPGAPFGDLSSSAWWDWYSFQFFRREAEELLRAADADSEAKASPP
jgi:hypothetical protein